MRVNMGQQAPTSPNVGVSAAKCQNLGVHSSVHVASVLLPAATHRKQCPKAGSNTVQHYRRSTMQTIDIAAPHPSPDTLSSYTISFDEHDLDDNGNVRARLVMNGEDLGAITAHIGWTAKAER